MRFLRHIVRWFKPGSRHVTALIVVVAILVGLIAFAGATRSTVTVGPLTLVLSARPAWPGRTVVEVPPFGQAEARTHKAPVRLAARVEMIDFEAARSLIDTASPLGALGDLTGEVGTLTDVGGPIWRGAALGILAAVAAAALVTVAARIPWRATLFACAATLILTSGLLGAAARTWDAAAFREPTLHGGLAHLPQLADVFTLRVARIERLRTQAAKVARDIASYYADERSLASGGPLPATVRILHVTDLHLDAVGAELEAGIARAYDVAGIIDTGDAPILGVTLEERALESLLVTEYPRIYIPGNHDSPVSLRALDAIPGVTVLTTGVAEIAGVRVFGIPDPISRDFGVEPDKEAIASQTAAAFDRFANAIRSGEQTPDIVAIHNPAMEKPFFGKVPVILSGHTHSARLYMSQGTARVNSGTIGGTPYLPEQLSAPLPHSASILYFTDTFPRRLVAIDSISVGTDRTTTVTRRIVDESLLPGASQEDAVR